MPHARTNWSLASASSLEPNNTCLLENGQAPSRLAQQPMRHCTPLKHAHFLEVHNHSELRRMPWVESRCALWRKLVVSTTLAVVGLLGEDPNPEVSNFHLAHPFQLFLQALSKSTATAAYT